MSKIDLKFMKGDRTLAKAMGATYGKKTKNTKTKKSGSKK